MTFRHLLTFLGVLSALILVPAVQAANLFINDSVEAQITLAHDANWEFGALSNGMPFGSRVGGSTTARGESATFSGSWIVNSPGNPDPGTGIIYFVDQAGNKHDCDRRHRRNNRRHSLDQSRHLGDRSKCRRSERRKLVVSDIVRANWSTVGGRASISFTIRSSACGRNLGRLPRRFASQGVPDPTSAIQIGGLFRNPATAAPVAIPSNLTVQFVGDADTACPRDDEDDDDDDEDDDDEDDD
jgi:hypothetical protein